MKRRASWLAGAAVLAMGMTAQAEAVEIEYWQYFFQGRVDAIDTLIETFEAENPDIQITHTTFPYADYRTKVAAAIPAGQGPDVVQLFYGWLNDYIDAVNVLDNNRFNQISRELQWRRLVVEWRRITDGLVTESQVPGRHRIAWPPERKTGRD